MSRTDKTRPYWVKLQEHPVEHHDHRDGVCDLASGRATARDHGWKRGKCYIDADWTRSEFRCGCSMCDADAYQVPRKRRQRIEAKQQIREQLADL